MLKILLIIGCLLSFLVLPQAYAGQVNSFIYHRFDEARYPSTNISAEIFSRQLEYTKQQNIQIISLGEVSALLSKNKLLPEYAVSFSVDDAFRSFFDVGMPIIRQYQVPVTLFVNTAAVGTSGYMNWDELRGLAAEGVEIGNHTDTHPYLVELEAGETNEQWQQRIQQDVLRSQQQFEKHLGFKPTIFAYPYGEYSAEVVKIIKDIGFEAAFAQQSGVIHAVQNRFVLPRFPMGGAFATLAGFKNKLAMKPLLVTNSDPFDPIIQTNPPILSLQISGEPIAPHRFNCFVQGENRCRVEADETKGERWYRVVAEKPLTGRRNKYTLTLQSGQGDWLWYSHLWINVENL
ncbi:MAG: polysaccharide deacetylase family protein [Thermodesulfobacteriota bacterium]|nr:polysaccharide deacetylase family protein [Thermodesulfobacteriota bacterium]